MVAETRVVVAADWNVGVELGKTADTTRKALGGIGHGEVRSAKS